MARREFRRPGPIIATVRRPEDGGKWVGPEEDRRRILSAAIDAGTFTPTIALASLPVFFTGLLLVYVFYFVLGWVPAPLGRLDAFATAPPQVTGFYLIDSLLVGDLETFKAAASQIILPAITLGFFALAPIARITPMSAAPRRARCRSRARSTKRACASRR